MPVITFSRTFPSTHVRKTEPTRFVEQIYNSFGIPFLDSDFWTTLKRLNPSLPRALLNEFQFSLDPFIVGKKHHTIRAGNKWKAGMKFSPRVWSGKPYYSKQIIIAPDIEIKKVWQFSLHPSGVPSIGTSYYTWQDHHLVDHLAKSDGLSVSDFRDWFIPNLKTFKGFSGQIISWSDEIEY